MLSLSQVSALADAGAAWGGDATGKAFAKSYLPNLNIPAKRLEMALPEGLVDLNPPEKVSVMTITPESGSR